MGNVLSVDYQQEPCSVQVGDLGTLNGLSFKAKDGQPLVKRYLNVPYALPPTGQHRFKRPRPLPSDYSYAGRDCSEFGPICPQPRYTSIAVKDSHKYDEDCLVLNIWHPATPPPEGGWPVMVWFHGGWLQMGDPSNDPSMDPTELLAKRGANLNCLFIAAAYRLSVLGFIASKELREEDGEGICGNAGFWDQRLALEWAVQNAKFFGGNPERLIVSGRSAGAYSAHAQAAHDFFMRPKEEQLPIESLVMYSNAIPANPKTVEEVQPQFDELCEALSIPSTSTGAEKLQALREVDVQELIQKVMTLKAHTFRAVRDGHFFPLDLFERFTRGEFAREFKQRHLRLLIGEVRDEETVYRETNPPTDAESLYSQVENYYAPAVARRVVQMYLDEKIKHSSAHQDPNPSIDSWKKVYGDIVSDGQVRAPSRLLVSQLKEAGVPLSDVQRYLINWRPVFVDMAAPRTFGVGHACDKPLWNFSVMHGPNKEEEKTMREWISILVEFVEGKAGKYESERKSWEEHVVLRPDGSIAVEHDDKWDYLQVVGQAMSAAE